MIPLKAGQITETVIAAELGEVATGAKRGRTSESDITPFKSIGVAIENIAAAVAAYEKAMV